MAEGLPFYGTDPVQCRNSETRPVATANSLMFIKGPGSIIYNLLNNAASTHVRFIVAAPDPLQPSLFLCHTTSGTSSLLAWFTFVLANFCVAFP